MGRHVVGLGTDYAKLRNLLIGVTGSLAALTGARFVIPLFIPKSTPKEKASLASAQPPSAAKQVYRKAVEPVGILTPKISRNNLSKLPLFDTNDRGDMLFLLSPPSAKYREYLHVYNGKSVRSGRLGETVRLMLTPNGSLIKRFDFISPFGAGRSGSLNYGWGYNEYRFFKRFTDDGSLIFIESKIRKKILTTTLVKQKQGEPAKVFFTSHFQMGINEIDDSGSIWVREMADSRLRNHDRLLKFSGGQMTDVPFPPGYTTVERVAAYGSTVTATFGTVANNEPVRAFMQTPKGWKELPLPAGGTFAFVQKVFDNGLVLGFVTDENRDNMTQVVWKGDSVALLNKQPGWPRVGQLSFVNRANRKGDIYVRSVLNTESGISENYLLHVSP